MQTLQTLLPQRPKVEIPQGEHVEEVNLMDHESHDHRGGGGAEGPRREAYDSDDEEGAGSGGMGGQRVQCAHQ